MKSKQLLRPIVVTLSAVFMGLGTLAGFGVIGTRVEDSAGGAFSADATLLTPATQAFSIWSLIYVGLAGYVIWQWTALRNPEASQIAWLASTSMVLNAIWLGVTQLGWIWPSVAVILTLAVVLGMIMDKLSDTQPKSLVERIFVYGTFGAYLGWVTVASVPNVAIALISAGVDPGAPWAETITIAVLAVAAGIGVLFAIRLGARWSVTAAMSWALAWIAIARLSGPLYSTPVAIAAIAAALVVVGANTRQYMKQNRQDTPSTGRKRP